MHLRAASSPQETSKSASSQSGAAKMSGKAAAASTTSRRTSSLTSSELPRPRRSSTQAAAGPRQADKENEPVAASKPPKVIEPEQKPRRSDVNLSSTREPMSTFATKANTLLAPLARAAPLAEAEPLQHKPDNAKAFQSAVSPLMHFDDPTITMFNGLAIGGDARSVSSPAVLQQHCLAANYPSVPTLPNPYNAGFGAHAAAQYSAAFAHPSAYYYYPAHATDCTAFTQQGYSAPSSPATPMSASTTPTAQAPAGFTHTPTTRSQQYPASLGLGHPIFYGPSSTTTTTAPQSANTSLSLSSVTASSLGFPSPANSRSTSASSAVSFGSDPGAACMYPIPYAYPTPLLGGGGGYIPAGRNKAEDNMTVRERLEGGEVLSSRGACKFFDVEKGFGFIIDDHAEELGADVFIHYTGIEQTSGFRCLAQHERVEYALVKHSSGRFQALKLRGEHGAPLKGLDDPRQAAAFERMNNKAAALWSEDEENVCPPSSAKGHHRRRRYALAYYKGNMRVPPRIRRTPAEEDRCSSSSGSDQVDAE
ncbi:hypothetical protein JCM3774_000550 [Rhodotorula dairenensis]